jgi:hypothetical protein
MKQSAIPGKACVHLISRWRDRRLVYKPGPAYEQYMQCVPALNLVADLTRLLHRRAKRPPIAVPDRQDISRRKIPLDG